MALYIVGYDLKSEEDYAPLIKELKSFSNWWHCLDSTWIVESELTAEKVRDLLRNYIYADDKLLVAYYLHSSKGGSAAWFGFDKECRDWLKTNL